MGKSKKDLKKQKARDDAAAGILPHDPKADKKKANASCSICKVLIIIIIHIYTTFFVFINCNNASFDAPFIHVLIILFWN